MGDKNPKHPLKKKKVVQKGNVANQNMASNDDLESKSKKHAN